MSEPKRVAARVAAHDLPAGDFPFTITFIALDTREVLDTVTVTGPGAVRIPSFAPRPVAVEILWPDGRRLYEEPE